MKYRLLIEYDGGPYCGWQRQQSQPTVQATIEQALATALRQPVSIVGAGRTDSGVHARGQVAHFELANTIDVNRLRRSLNGLTPPSVVVHALEMTPKDFHARYDAVSRRYHYYINLEPTALDRHIRLHVPHKVDLAAMNAAAARLLGTHHFGAFCLTGSATVNRECIVTHAQWVHETPPFAWRFEVEANRFLHGMVRTMVGTFLDIGRGKMCAGDLCDILESRDRRRAGPAVPAHGLILETVRYRTITPVKE